MFVQPPHDLQSTTSPLTHTLLDPTNSPTTAEVAPSFLSTWAATPFLLESADPFSRLEEQSRNLAKIMWIYLGPCIFIVGIVGNLLIILVMGHSHMRGTSTCTYLRWMAVADIFTLLTGMIPDWLEHMDIIILKEVSEVTCKLEKFLNFCSTDTSIWICVVFTIDRFVAVCFPMSENFLCPPSNAKFHVAISFGAAVLKNIHVLWTRGAEFATIAVPVASQNSSLNHSHDEQLVVPVSGFRLVSNCGSPTEQFKNFEKYIRPWIAFVVISLIPCLVIIICNVFIIRSLLMLKLNKNKIPSDKERGTVLQMTVLCLTASVCFLVCNTPSMIVLIGKPYWNIDHNKTYKLAKPIINQFFFVNHSINFFLYCITGKRFRQSLCLMCQSYKHRGVSYELSRQELLHRGSNRSNNQQILNNYAILKPSFRVKHPSCSKPGLSTVNETDSDLHKLHFLTDVTARDTNANTLSTKSICDENAFHTNSLIADKILAETSLTVDAQSL